MAHLEMEVVVEAVDNVLHLEAVGNDLHLGEVGRGHLQAEVDSDPHLVAVDKGPLQENEVCCFFVICIVHSPLLATKCTFQACSQKERKQKAVM